jgi:adenylate kinase
MNLLLYGPPGSGKGTQAGMLTQQFGIPHISTGDILRAEVKAGTPLGREAQPIMARGDYVPDAIMIGIIRNRLAEKDTAPGFILDGFPRTIPQAEALDALLAEMGKGFDHVLYLRVDTPELMKRLAGRMALEQRADDQPEAVQNRIEVYLSKTLPLLDYYRSRGLVSEIPGMGTKEEIYSRVLQAVGRGSGVGNP